MFLPPIRSLFALAASFAVCGCGSLFFAQVEEPEVCKTSDADYTASTSTGTSSQSASVEFDMPSVFTDLKKLDYTGQFALTFAQIDAKQGIADFSFVDRVVFGLNGVTEPSCSAPNLISYQRQPSDSAASPLVLRPTDSVDLISCLTAGRIKLMVTFTGRLPAAPWSITYQACFRASARVNYLNRK